MSLLIHSIFVHPAATRLSTFLQTKQNKIPTRLFARNSRHDSTTNAMPTPTVTSAPPPYSINPTLESQPHRPTNLSPSKLWRRTTPNAPPTYLYSFRRTFFANLTTTLLYALITLLILALTLGWIALILSCIPTSSTSGDMLTQNLSSHLRP